jgi:hypothetical protein
MGVIQNAAILRPEHVHGSGRERGAFGASHHGPEQVCRRREVKQEIPAAKSHHA